MLQKITPAAWDVVRLDSVPEISETGTTDENSDGTKNVPGGTFSENLLRTILPLRRKQQVELCAALAAPKKDDRITKDKVPPSRARARGK